MKHTVTFLLLLALILSIGYYSAGLPELASGKSENRSIEISREDSDFNAVFFSGSESGFDPMRLIVPDENAGKKGYFRMKTDIAAAIAAVFSKYDPRNEYAQGKDIPIEKAMQVSQNNYVYTSGYVYLNPAGEERSMDCIITANNFKIVYIRFRSPEVSEPDSRKAKNSLDKFNSIYNDFYAQQKFTADYSSAVSKVSDAIIEAEPWEVPECKDFDSAYSIMDTMSVMADSQPPPANLISRFWLRSVVFLINGLNYFSEAPDGYLFNEKYVTVSGSEYIAELLLSTPPAGDPEYTVFGDSIFQTVYYRQKKLITIYSITDDCIEGFYAYGI